MQKITSVNDVQERYVRIGTGEWKKELEIYNSNIVDNQITGTKLVDNYMHRDIAYLSETTDLNDIKKDGLYVVTTAVNKPSTMKSTGLLQVKSFKNSSGIVQWVMQEITSLNDVQEKYSRLGTGEWKNITGIDTKFTGKTIMFLGDSITVGEGASSSDYHVYKYFGTLTGAITSVKAKSGGSWQLDGKVDSLSIVTQVQSFNVDDYEYVVIWAGTNDWGRGGGLPIGTISDKDPSSSMYGAMRYVIENLLSKKPDLKITLLTPIFRNRDEVVPDMLDCDYENQLGYKLTDYCKAIINVANLYNIPVLDLYHTSNINIFNRDTFLSDGLHPNDAGYKMLTEKIFAFMNSVY